LARHPIHVVSFILSIVIHHIEFLGTSFRS